MSVGEGGALCTVGAISESVVVRGEVLEGAGTAIAAGRRATLEIAEVGGSGVEDEANAAGDSVAVVRAIRGGVDEDGDGAYAAGDSVDVVKATKGGGDKDGDGAKAAGDVSAVAEARSGCEGEVLCDRKGASLRGEYELQEARIRSRRANNAASFASFAGSGTDMVLGTRGVFLFALGLGSLLP